MNDIGIKLQTLISDDASFRLIKLILDIMQQKDSIAYNQGDVINFIDAAKDTQYKKLKSLNLRFHGLCELVSNAVIADDLMGNSEQILRSSMAKFKKTLLDVEPSGDESIRLIYAALLNNTGHVYDDSISPIHLNTFSNTHTLDVSSYFQHMFSYFLGVYPFDLFSFEDKVQVGETVDQAVLGKKLDELEDGSYIKFMRFSKGWTGFDGHAMVIKKTGKTFSFFDPNVGETFNLSLPRLCKCINEAKSYGTHMAFIDGKKFIQYINELNVLNTNNQKTNTTGIESGEQNSINESMSSFILSEIDKIAKMGQCRDEDLINAVNSLRTHVERFIQNREPSTTATNKSDRYIRDHENKKLKTLDDIRFKIKKEFWCDLVKEQEFCLYKERASNFNQPFNEYSRMMGGISGYALCKVNNEHKIYYIDQNKKELVTINPKADYYTELYAQLDTMPSYLQYVEASIWHTSKIYKISGIPSTLEHTGLEEDDLSPSINDLKLPLEKLESCYDFGVLIQLLNVKNCQKLCELQSIPLVNLIKTSRDVGVLFNHLKKDQDRQTGDLKCAIIFNIIKTKLPKIVQSANDVEVVLSVLSPEQRVEFIDEDMLSCLPDMIKSAGDLGDVFHYLSPEQRAVLFDKIITRLPEIINNSSNSGYEFQLALSVLLPIERTIFFNAMKEKLSSLDVEDLSVLKAIHGYLNENEVAMFIESMHENPQFETMVLNTYIAATVDASTFVQYMKILPERLHTVYYNAVKEKLLNFFSLNVEPSDALNELAKILETVPSTEYESFISNEKLTAFLDRCLPKEIESFFKALLSNNHELIPVEFDRLVKSHNKYSWNPFDSYKPKIDQLINNISSMHTYWLKKINHALELNLDDKQLAKNDMTSSLHKYLNNPSVRDYKSHLHRLKESEENSDSKGDDNINKHVPPG